MKHWPATAGLSRGTKGRRMPAAAQVRRCREAARTVMVLGGFQRARNGAAKICRKLPKNGSEQIRPIVVFGSG